jgi:hypothetical protein
MNHQRSILTLTAARNHFKVVLGLAAVAMALASVMSAAAAPGGPHDAKGPPPGAHKAGGIREQFGGGKRGPDGKRPDHEHGPGHGMAGAPGFNGPHHDAMPPGLQKKLEELKQKEAAGKLTDDEKKELARLTQFQEHRKSREERKARLAELKQKETDGKLTDDEKKELEKAKQIQARHDELDKRDRDRAETRRQRAREAKRQALKESPKVANDAATTAEYKKYAERLAKLERAKELATADQNTDAVSKIDKLIAQETQRHQAWLAKQRAATNAASQGAQQ